MIPDRATYEALVAVSGIRIAVDKVILMEKLWHYPRV
jgi:hypothetical protein